MLRRSGFTAIAIVPKPESREVIKQWIPGSGAEDFVVAANVSAIKPSSATGPVTRVPADSEHDLPVRGAGKYPPVVPDGDGDGGC